MVRQARELLVEDGPRVVEEAARREELGLLERRLELGGAGVRLRERGGGSDSCGRRRRSGATQVERRLALGRGLEREARQGSAPKGSSMSSTARAEHACWAAALPAAAAAAPAPVRMLGSEYERRADVLGADLFEVVRGQRRFGLVGAGQCVVCGVARPADPGVDSPRLVGLFDELVAELAEHLAALARCRGRPPARPAACARPRRRRAPRRGARRCDHLATAASFALPRAGRRGASVGSIDFGAISSPMRSASMAFAWSARVAKRRRVGQDAGDLLVTSGGRRRLADLFDDLEAALDDDFARRFRWPGARRCGGARAAALRSPLSPTSSYDADVSPSDCESPARGGPRRQARAAGRPRRGDRGARGEALHALVVRGELQQLRDELVEELRLAPVARDARHLLLDFDGLGGLPDLR